ncbi:MAG: SMC family ATPase, partial [Chloroflexota bacterium]
AALRRKATEERLALVDARLADVDQELGEKEARQAALLAAQADLNVIAEQLAVHEKLLEQWRRAAAAVKQQRETVKNLAENLARARRTFVNLQTTQAQRQKERAAYQLLLDQATQITAEYAAWEAADALWQSWQAKAEQYHALQRARRPHELALERERSKLAQQQDELEKQAGRVAAMRDEQATLTASLATGRAHLTELETRLTATGQAEVALHEARAELQRLEGERKLLAQTATQWQTRARQVAALADERPVVEKNRLEAAAMIANLTAQLDSLTEQQARHAQARAEMDSLAAGQPGLKDEMDKLKDRVNRLQAESGGECPVCGQALTEQHRLKVLNDSRAEGTQKADLYRRNKARIQELAAEAAELEKQLKRRPAIEREQQAQQQRLATTQARLDEIERAIIEWQAEGEKRLAELQAALADDQAIQAQQAKVGSLATAVQVKAALDKEYRDQQRQISQAEARLQEIERTIADWQQTGVGMLAAVCQRLNTQNILPEAQAALAKLDEQAAALGYDPAAHETARHSRQALAQAPGRLQELKQAQAAVKPLDETLADLARQITEQEGNVAHLAQQHEAAVAQLEAAGPDSEAELLTVEGKVFELREAAVAVNRRVGAAQQRLDVLADLRRQREELTAERADVTRLIQRLKVLEKACGRDGVQALLIEHALPEIEETANDLLSRLTGGDMRVTFETQKPMKTREAMAETLEIKIEDSTGGRPYENYSGGEQFRINFAIRLALSHILAKRAGARLRTLVIDEGFGSQDPLGRQRLVEAIHAVQHDFARVLVITHIDELRDAFPTRIEVEKTPAGSVIVVN